MITDMTVLWLHKNGSNVNNEHPEDGFHTRMTTGLLPEEFFKAEGAITRIKPEQIT